MKYLLLVTVLLGLSTPTEAVTTRMFKVLDTCARYRLNEKTALVAIKDLKLKYEGKDESEAVIVRVCASVGAMWCRCTSDSTPPTPQTWR